MSVGIPTTKAEVDQAGGALARSMFNLATNIAAFKTWLDAQTDVVLEASPYGYTAGEVALLRSTYTDLINIVNIWNGSATGITLPHDHRIFANQIAGILR
jgi:hypothetical protein